MIDRHLAKVRARSEISTEEEQAIRASVSEYRDYPADKVIIPAYVQQDHSTLLLDGIMCRFKDLRNGSRQVTELHVAGDFVDLHSFTLKYLDHDIMTLTPSRVALVPHKNLQEMTEAFPRLARMYWFQTNVDAAVHREWELSLGRRSALARVAVVLSELQIRLQIVGLADESGYDLPLTQTDIAECMGLTNVSVNRCLRQLREEGVLEYQEGRVAVTNRDRLWQIAEYDKRYLYLDNLER